MVVEERVEGLDISAEYMVSPVSEPSFIADVFKDNTVFITGATGFLGKLTLEKILRTCPDVKKIYIVIREKKGKDVPTRRKEMFDNEVFDVLRRQYPKFEEKIEIISGDLTQSNLGMTEIDIQKLVSEVNFIFHIAATVRFDEHIRIAVKINVEATRDLLRMAKRMYQLKAFVHVSTAYSQCPRTDVQEKFYNVPVSPEKLIDVVNALDDNMLTTITPTLIGKWPNTYVFTKAVAEMVVRDEAQNLPVTLVRPAIVTSTFTEPLAGWIDNLYGATGVVMGVAIGLVRSLHGAPTKLADIVPADYVVNCIIASAWDVAVNKHYVKPSQQLENTEIVEEDEDSTVKIYNYVSSPEKPITWGEFMDLTVTHAMKIPSELCIWYYCFSIVTNPYLHMLRMFLLHTLPANIVDFGARCLGKKPKLVEGYRKIHKFIAVISYFSSRDWKFSNKNTQLLWTKLNSTDRKQFSFSISHLEWENYFPNYMRGARVYLLKDPMETLEKGKAWYRKLFILHYFVVTVFSLLLLKLAHTFCTYLYAKVIG